MDGMKADGTVGGSDAAFDFAVSAASEGISAESGVDDGENGLTLVVRGLGGCASGGVSGRSRGGGASDARGFRRAAAAGIAARSGSAGFFDTPVVR
jgi:hypothetical protein